MLIRTLDLKQAAEFLKISPRLLSQKAAKGEVPGAKVGRCWCFREDDLAQYIRSLYVKKRKLMTTKFDDRYFEDMCEKNLI